jgi:hypothetical protein
MRSEQKRRKWVAMDPHVEVMLALIAVSGWLMTKAGLAKNALEPKRRKAACPSCGKHSGCTCGS